MRQQFIFLIFCIWNVSLYAQGSASTTPLHYYLQNNFDTTIVLHSWSAWDGKPNYRIICKQDGQINAFTYQFPFSLFNGRAMPKELAKKLISRSVAFTFMVPDTNAYFIPHMFWQNIKEQQIKKSLDSLQLWTMADDQKDGYGCGDKGCAIFDSGEYDIWLITKKEITKLHFYAPDYYETCCPGRKGRVTFLAFEKLMNTIFQ